MTHTEGGSNLPLTLPESTGMALPFQTCLQGRDKQGSERRAYAIDGGKDGLEGQRSKVAVEVCTEGVCPGGGHRGSVQTAQIWHDQATVKS